MKIVLTGGGTGGSVAPLLAIAEEIKKQRPETEFIFIGTRRGLPEREMIKDYGYKFHSIFSGKLRRYFSWQNFLDISRTKIGFLQSLFILAKNKPDLIIGAGGYVSVPVVLAGWFLKIPAIIHQQDIIPSLTNKILACFAKKITVSFESSLKDFSKNKTIFTGQPVRRFIFSGDKERAVKLFNLEKEKPILVVLGGGTGAASLNELIWENLDKLTEFCQVIHLAGKGKSIIRNSQFIIPDDYHPYEFLTNEIPDLFVIADVVISRAGVNVLAELAVLGKPTIIIPIPDSHQEANAKYFQDKGAAIVLNQKELTNGRFLNKVKELITNKEKQNKLAENIKKIVSRDAGEKIVNQVLKLVIR